MILDIDQIRRVSLTGSAVEETESIVLATGRSGMSKSDVYSATVEIFTATFNPNILCFIFWAQEFGLVTIALTLGLTSILQYYSCKSMSFVSDQYGLGHFVYLTNLFPGKIQRCLFLTALTTIGLYSIFVTLIDIYAYFSLAVLDLDSVTPKSVPLLPLGFLVLGLIALSGGIKDLGKSKKLVLSTFIFLSSFFFIFAIAYGQITIPSIDEPQGAIIRSTGWIANLTTSVLIVRMMFTSAVQVKVVDVYVSMDKRNQSKMAWAIFIQALFSYFFSLAIAALGVYIVPNLSSLIKSPLVLSMLFKNMGIKVVWNILMLIVCLGNFMYLFNMVRQVVVYLWVTIATLYKAPIDDSSVPPGSHAVETNEMTHWLIALVLQLVLTAFTALFVSKELNVESSAGGILVVLAPLIYITMPILVHSGYLKSKRLMTVMTVTMLLWAWMIVTIALSFLKGSENPDIKPNILLV